MSDLIDLLEDLNRKERFHLIKQVQGTFKASSDFRENLSQEVGIAIPGDAFAAMDYHLDWLAAALRAYERGDSDKCFDNGRQEVKGTQEDIDLLVAFRERDGQYHIVLVEAKGDTAWGNTQMNSKANRLESIFGIRGDRYPKVTPHFCLMSPSLPEWLKDDKWPKWMQKEVGYFWLRLAFPESPHRVTRCDADGNPSAKGKYFRISN